MKDHDVNLFCYSPFESQAVSYFMQYLRLYLHGAHPLILILRKQIAVIRAD
jgi:hypothetical protein